MRMISSISLSLLLAVAACGGSDGDDGVSQLVDVGSEPAGSNCSNGGSVITSGTDDNGNGVLDADEVESTEYVCDPSSGDPTSVLVSLADEPAGSNCAAGGVAVNSGVDDDGSGTLESGEIDSTSYVCDGEAGSGTLTAEGTVVITDPLHLALLGQFDVIEGDLVFSGDNLPADISLPNLTTVDGTLELASEVVGTVTLEALTSVGGLVIGPNTDATALTAFSVPMLAGAIAGDIDVTLAPVLTALDLGGVTDVGGTLSITACDLLASLDLSGLVTAGGLLEIANLPELLALDLGALTTVTGSFSIHDNTQLATLTVTLLASVGSNFYIGQTVATDLSAPALTTVTGDFAIEENNSLATLGFDVLATISGTNLNIRNNDVLPCIEVEEIIDDFALVEDATGNENGATDCNAN